MYTSRGQERRFLQMEGLKGKKEGENRVFHPIQ